MVMHPAVKNRLIKKANAFLIQICSIDRLQAGQGDFMTPTNTWRLVAAGVKCRVISKSRSYANQVIVSANQEALKDEYHLVVPLETDLKAEDRVTVGGQTYTVVRLETELTDEFFLQAKITRRVGEDHD